MNLLTIEVATDQAINARIVRAIERNEPQPPVYFFDSEEALFDSLTSRRIAILKALSGAKPMSLRTLTRRVKSDLRTVHADVERLVFIGLIDKTAQGQLHFPYDGIRLELAWAVAA